MHMSLSSDNDSHEKTVYSLWIERELQKKSEELGKRYTIYKLASDSGVPQPTVRRIAIGESKNPSRETIIKIAQALGTPSPDDIESGTQLNLVSNNKNPAFQSLNQRILTEVFQMLQDDMPDFYEREPLNQARIFKMLYQGFVNDASK